MSTDFSLAGPSDGQAQFLPRTDPLFSTIFMGSINQPLASWRRARGSTSSSDPGAVPSCRPVDRTQLGSLCV